MGEGKTMNKLFRRGSTFIISLHFLELFPIVSKLVERGRVLSLKPSLEFKLSLVWNGKDPMMPLGTGLKKKYRILHS